MKPLFNFQKKSGPIVGKVLVVLSILCFCTGCDKKHQLKIGDSSPAISGKDIRGELFSLDQLKGKVVIIFFWTNSCCGAKLKQLEPFYRQYKDKGMEILAVDVGDSKEIVESFAQANGITFTLKTDENGETSKRYGIFGFPTIFIIDRNGIIREKIHGDAQTGVLEKLVVKQFRIQKEVEANYQKIHP